MVTDLRHFLDITDDAPGPARRLAEQLGHVVRAGTAGPAGTTWVSAIACTRRPQRRVCPGTITVTRTDLPAAIEWACTSCGDDGVISGWEHSLFDLRAASRTAKPSRAVQVVVPVKSMAALRSISLIDTETERLIYTAHMTRNGAVLHGTEDDFDDLLGYIAAEANHTPNRTHRQQLDQAYGHITRAQA